MEQSSTTPTLSASATQMETSVFTNSTAGLATPSTDTDSLDDSTALIGGIVGGVIALLLVGGLITCLVARSRRRASSGEPNSDAAMQSVRQSASNNAMNSDFGVASHRSNSNYEALTLSPPEETKYGTLSVGPQNYDTWSPNEYDHGDVKKFIE
jgi:hypothetical protein